MDPTKTQLVDIIYHQMTKMTVVSSVDRMVIWIQTMPTGQATTADALL